MEQVQKFFPIDLTILRLDTLKPFDIYLKTNLGKQRYVLYSRQGLYFTNKIRQNLLINRVSTIYVPVGHRELYQQYIEDNLQYIIKDKTVASEQKSKIVYESSTYLMQKIFENPDTEMIERTKKTVNNIVNLILSDQKTTTHLMLITEHDYYTYTHSVNVGVYSIALAKEILSGISKKEFYDLGMGFFFHDIGKSRIPPEILKKKGPLNEDEWKIMQKHPEDGYKILEEAGLLNKTSATILLQHHERPDGSGYPKGLQGNAIHLYGKMCSMADTFDAMTTERYYQKACSAFDALKVIKNEMSNEFDKDFFAKFVMLFAPERMKYFM